MNNPSSAATLYDVAAKAGVSVATASRVLSGSKYPVSSKLKHRVTAAAKELNYIPNIFGQMLRSNATEAIGIIVPSLQNPFYNQVIFGIESAAAGSGHEIRLLSSHRSVEQERNSIMFLLHSRVMSLIISSVDTSPDTLNMYIEAGGRVALLEADFQLENAISAVSDSVLAGQMAAKHLVELGHTKIAFLSTPITKLYRQRVLSGVKEELARNKIRFTAKDVYTVDSEAESQTGQFEFETGKLLVSRIDFRKEQYTAIIAVNDLTAYGVIQALNQKGLRVPDDISVISLDNIIYSEMISPPLTTVEMPSSNMGFTACQMIIAAMESRQKTASSMEFRYPCVLKVRSSTRDIREDHDSPQP